MLLKEGGKTRRQKKERKKERDTNTSSHFDVIGSDQPGTCCYWKKDWSKLHIPLLNI